MTIPMSPPDTDALLRSIVERGDSAYLAKLLRNPSGPAPDGRYLHWDELRRRQPPPGLETEDWWVSVKTARRLLYKDTPFRDKAGKPFVFALVDPILALLHRIDREASGQIRLAASIANPEQRDSDRIRSLIEEAINSRQLEGASTTRQVAKEMPRQGRRPRNKGETMIFNNWSALSQGYRLLEFVPISGILKKAPAQYARSYLFTETDESDVTYFLIHQL